MTLLLALALAAASPCAPPALAGGRTLSPEAAARSCALVAAPALPGATAAERAKLAEILARPELSRRPGDPDALRRALLALRAWLVELLGTAEAERWASLGRALFLAAAAGAATLLALGLRRRRAGAPRRARAPGPDEEVRAAPDASADRAEEALRAGDAREAVRQAFLAALGALERDGRVPRGRALTNGEVVAALADEPAAPAAEIADLARAFDRAVYGGLPVAAEDARAAVARARLVVAAGAPR